MEDGMAVARLDLSDWRQLVRHSGGNQQKAGRLLGAICERHAKSAVTPASVGYTNRTELDTVSGKLVAPQRIEREGWDAVACQIGGAP